MRVISQAELARLSRAELQVMLRQIVEQLPMLPAGSHELRIAHANLTIIRKAMTMVWAQPRAPG